MLTKQVKYWVAGVSFAFVLVLFLVLFLAYRSICDFTTSDEYSFAIINKTKKTANVVASVPNDARKWTMTLPPEGSKSFNYDVRTESEFFNLDITYDDKTTTSMQISKYISTHVGDQNVIKITDHGYDLRSSRPGDNR